MPNQRHLGVAEHFQTDIIPDDPNHGCRGLLLIIADSKHSLQATKHGLPMTAKISVKGHVDAWPADRDTREVVIRGKSRLTPIQANVVLNRHEDDRAAEKSVHACLGRLTPY